MSVDIRVGDALSVLRDMPDDSVHCCVTSPPYWGLRSYGGDPGMIGLEPTFDEHLENIVAVFCEVRRVLRPDGTLWLNYGDAYAAHGGAGKQGTDGVMADRGIQYARRRREPDAAFKPKDLMLMPARVAMRLQSDGWWLRSEIIWHKPNPMPESCRDRPTTAHEKLFLLTKSARYFYDAEAVKEPVSGTAHARAAKHNTAEARKERANPDAAHTPTAERRGMRTPKDHDGRSARMGREVGWREKAPGVSPKSAPAGSGIKANESFHEATHQLVSTRNRRNVWTIPTAPYKGAHFATFPPALVEPCIKAGTSEKGVCAECGAPWNRETGEKQPASGRGSGNKVAKLQGERGLPEGHPNSHRASSIPWTPTITPTTGWFPTCECDGGVAPCVVLDPFGGSGTVGMVANRLGRHAILIEINPDYAEMARKRIHDDAPLLAEHAA